jgi:hypothetical protein
LISGQYDGQMTIGQWGSEGWLHASQATGPQRGIQTWSPIKVNVSFESISEAAGRLLRESGSPEIAEDSGWACAWLQACGYPGLELMFEALETTSQPARNPPLTPDSLGLDLHNISCVFLAPGLDRMVRQQGRLFLRNVRHGLYLLPFSVRANVGIGCPVDPAFALGGERTKNPYEERLALAGDDGIAVPEGLWRRLTS